MTAMDITIYQTLLPHDDPDASLAFYRDGLDFEVRNDVEYGGMHWITVGPAGQPGTFHRPVPAGRTIAEMMAKGTAEVVQEPTEQPYGVRDCAFRDPAGNLIRIQKQR
jgi:catechol 2,3-dioxygenase-like lactoylglutathione lyase family enzyme